MSNLLLRLLSGSLYVALIIASIYFSPPWFAVAMSLFCLLALLEIMSINEKSVGANTKLTALVYAAIIIYLCLFQQTDKLKYEYLFAFIIQILSVIFIYQKLKKDQKPQLLFNTLYIWLPLATLALWATQNAEIAKDHLYFFFIVIWCYDSLAYVVGKTIGKRPIFPKISPKKTIEGTVGGIILTLVVVFFLKNYLLNIDSNVFALALIVIVFSILGDFLESYLKRKLNIKDSGNIMPGHGGILDRIDSILFAAIPYIVLLSLS